MIFKCYLGNAKQILSLCDRRGIYVIDNRADILCQVAFADFIYCKIVICCIWDGSYADLWNRMLRRFLHHNKN